MPDHQAWGEWSLSERDEHINVLELRAIRLGLQALEDQLQGASVALMSDNTTALSYIRKGGGTWSRQLNQEAQLTLQWAEQHQVQLSTQFVRGKSNVVADCLSRRNQVISTEWTLSQAVCNSL